MTVEARHDKLNIQPIEQETSNPVNETWLEMVTCIARLGLKDIKVIQNIELRKSDSFTQNRVLAIPDVNDISVAVLFSMQKEALSSELEEFLPIIPIPTETGSSVFTDKKNSTLGTNFFWTIENGEFKMIQTEKPIHIDGFLPFFCAQDYEMMRRFMPESADFYDLVEDKNETKGVLLMENIRVPEGRIFNKSCDLQSEIEKLAKEFGTDLVVKGNNGYGGKFVRIFGQDDTENAIKYAQRLIDFGQKVLVEKRIDSGFEDDYCIRTLVTVSKSPKAIGSVVRIQTKSNNPVNAHQGADLMPIHEEIAQHTDPIAEKTVKELIKWTMCSGNHKQFPTGIAGVDIMIDKNGDITIIEVNSGLVGGPHTLVMFDQQPFAGFANILAPSLYGKLERSFKKRQGAEVIFTRELPYTTCDIFSADKKVGDPENYEQLLKARFEETGHTIILFKLATFFEEHGKTEEALECYNQVGMIDPDALHRKINLLIKCERLNEAEELILSETKQGTKDKRLDEAQEKIKKLKNRPELTIT